MKSLVEFLAEAKIKADGMVYHKRCGRGGQAPILKYIFDLQKEACKEQGIKFDDNNPWDQEDIIVRGDDYLQWLNGIVVFVLGQVHFPAAFSATREDTDITVRADGGDDGESDYFNNACISLLDNQYQGINAIVVNKKQNLILYFDNASVGILKTNDKKIDFKDLKSVDLEEVPEDELKTCGDYFKFALNKNGITKFDKILNDSSTEIYIAERDY